MQEDNNNNTKRSRGAPKGHRPVLWICAAVKDDRIISDECLVDEDPPGSGHFPKETAIKSFEETSSIDFNAL